MSYAFHASYTAIFRNRMQLTIFEFLLTNPERESSFKERCSLCLFSTFLFKFFMKFNFDESQYKKLFDELFKALVEKYAFSGKVDYWVSIVYPDIHSTEAGIFRDELKEEVGNFYNSLQKESKPFYLSRWQLFYSQRSLFDYLFEKELLR